MKIDSFFSPLHVYYSQQETLNTSQDIKEESIFTQNSVLQMLPDVAQIQVQYLYSRSHLCLFILLIHNLSEENILHFTNQFIRLTVLVAAYFCFGKWPYLLCSPELDEVRLNKATAWTQRDSEIVFSFVQRKKSLPIKMYFTNLSYIVFFFNMCNL